MTGNQTKQTNEPTNEQPTNKLTACQKLLRAMPIEPLPLPLFYF